MEAEDAYAYAALRQSRASCRHRRLTIIGPGASGQNRESASYSFSSPSTKPGSHGLRPGFIRSDR